MYVRDYVFLRYVDPIIFVPNNISYYYRLAFALLISPKWLTLSMSMSLSCIVLTVQFKIVIDYLVKHVYITTYFTRLTLI